jgi:protein-disulfide isomerase
MIGSVLGGGIRARSGFDAVATALMLAAAAVVLWTARSGRPAATTKAPGSEPVVLPPGLLSLKGAATQGSDRARVAMIEYTDFQCPFCGEFARDTLETIDAEYVRPGRVLFAVRPFPLESMHPFALQAAAAAECAGRQRRFWEMHKLLFADQMHLDWPALEARVRSLGLNAPKFAACLGGATEDVREEVARGRELGVSSTPTFFFGFNDRRSGRVQLFQRLTGALPISVLKAALDNLLAVAAKGVPARARQNQGGTAAVESDPRVCARATRVQLWWKDTAGLAPPPNTHVEAQVLPNGNSYYLRLVAESPVDNRCDWTFRDLAPGAYVASVTTSNGSGGSEAFTIKGSDVVQVAIPPPAVRVEGRALYDEMPLAEGTVEFWRDPAGGGSPTPFVAVTADAHGHYRADLDRPGRYQVYAAVRPRPEGRSAFLGKDHFGPKTASLAPGTNAFDVADEGAGLIARLHGWDGSTPTTLVFRRQDSADTVTLKAGDSPSVRRIGLRFGEYHVFAYEASGEVSRTPATVTLAPQLREAVIDLEMTPNRARLALRDARGRPVAASTIRAWLGGKSTVPAAEMAPGRYSLAGIPPGAEIQIRPPAPLMPVCRLATLDGTIDIQLQLGRHTEVVFERRGVGGPVGTLSGVAGSNCPVPLELFQFERRAAAPGDLTARAIIANFPVSPDLVFTYEAISSSVLRQPGGVAVLRH